MERKEAEREGKKKKKEKKGGRGRERIQISYRILTYLIHRYRPALSTVVLSIS